MRKIWVAAVVALAWVAMTAGARADTVYLKDGQRLWGSEVYEEGDTVVVVRPGGALSIPKAEVSRIERTRTSLPPFYAPPGATPPGAAPAGEGASRAPGPPSPAAPPAAEAPSAPPGRPAPFPEGPTQLPPAPAPPPPPGTPR